jgi:hypothetical protein
VALVEEGEEEEKGKKRKKKTTGGLWWQLQVQELQHHCKLKSSKLNAFLVKLINLYFIIIFLCVKILEKINK